MTNLCGNPLDSYGVYALVWMNENPNKIYIGSTTRRFRERMIRHLRMMKKGTHPKKKKRMSDAHMGHKCSKETRVKLSETIRKWHKNQREMWNELPEWL